MTPRSKSMVGVRLAPDQRLKLETLERGAARSRSELIRDALSLGLPLLEVRHLLEQARGPELARTPTATEPTDHHK